MIAFVNRYNEYLMCLCRKDGRCCTATFTHIPTFHPFANIALACALPIPLAAPVITATLPSIFISAPGVCDTAAAAATTPAVVAPTATAETAASAVTNITASAVTNAKITGAATFTTVTVVTATPGTAGTVNDAKGCVLLYGLPGSPGEAISVSSPCPRPNNY